MGEKSFSDTDSLKAYYQDPHNLPENVTYCGWQRQEDDRARAILHQGGHWAFGLYGQVLYVNPCKNIIGVYLGADRTEDFQNVFEKAINAL